MATNKKIKKVIVLGSAALKIGQAGEFDYSGSQAIKSLKEENIEVIVINPNIATVQTSEGFADRVYFLPVNEYFVTKVIEKEMPDGIILSFGGQTALNTGVELYKKGILKKNGVKVLGTDVQTIINTEDRDLFIKKLNQIKVRTAKSKAVTNIKDGIKIAEKLGFPVMIRSAYALGGLGSGVAKDKKELKEMMKKAFSHSKQVLVEECLKGWKEIEYEVVRDRYDNCITVCNMENFDPMGIHTGESIVIAPSQTLTNKEYHKLREISIRVIRHLKIVGECNIQFALDPYSEDYRVIEVNARLSRSSALASKATGYPLAFIAAKLALGYSLIELENSITKVTKACFEPALDYVVLKIPRWDLIKFRKVSKKIGSEMKSVGEVMAIGRKFEEILQKALRMLEIGMNGVVCNDIEIKDIDDEIKNPSDKRIFAIAKAIEKGYTIEKIHNLSGIDAWFLHKIKNIIDLEKKIKKDLVGNLRDAKKLGFSDKQIAILTKKDEKEIRKIRKKENILPWVKQIDTLGAEYPAKTNYLYLTYNGSRDDITFNDKNKVVVLGSGAYRIGSSVEFDFCCVSCVKTLKKMKYRTIMINYNPETVSTDYDECDKLYFDELSHETVMDIYEKEDPKGIIVSMGGQIPNNLAMKLYKSGANILGTSPENIDKAENRYKFSKLLDQIKVDQPEWKELKSIKEAEKFAENIGYPALIRPSYVLSGAAMSVAFNKKELKEYLKKATSLSPEYPVVISKFITGAREIEIDAVAYNGDIIVSAVSEHVENAGVHSGDATIVLPPQKTYLETIRRIKRIAGSIAKNLDIKGPFNMQFLAKRNQIKVIECNLRASRSFPFVSKVSKIDFIENATNAIMNKPTIKKKSSYLELDYVGVKAPQFSFSRLRGADPTLGVEMASTGEVGCLGEDLHRAFLKAMISVGFRLPKKSILVSIGGERSRYRLLESVRKLEALGFNIYSTKDTSRFLNDKGIKAKRLYKAHEKIKKPNVIDYMAEGKIDFVMSIPNPDDQIELDKNSALRRAAIDYNVPLITNIQIAMLTIDTILKIKIDDLKIKAWDEY